MRRQLAYKQLWRGGQVLAVPPAYTSQRCAYCGHTAKENRLSQSKCPGKIRFKPFDTGSGLV
ncbi:zinc ribbon domain-containing protein [Escherichia coli]|uniref:zinc ribbon domain-containing protein n=1 Tax=Escherichia coli TaxID=562 RepID=UPI0030B04268